MEGRHRNAAHPDQTRRDVSAMSCPITFLVSLLAPLLRIFPHPYLLLPSSCLLLFILLCYAFSSYSSSLCHLLFYFIPPTAETDQS